MRNIETLKEIDNLDFFWIENMLVNKSGFAAEKARRCVVLYKNILKIVALHPGRSVAPPSGADAAMHMHIIHTKRYSHDCSRIFGDFIHHDPEVFGTPEFWSAWRFTEQKLKQYFGICLHAGSEYEAEELQPEACMLMTRDYT